MSGWVLSHPGRPIGGRGKNRSFPESHLSGDTAHACSLALISTNSPAPGAPRFGWIERARPVKTVTRGGARSGARSARGSSRRVPVLRVGRDKHSASTARTQRDRRSEGSMRGPGGAGSPELHPERLPSGPATTHVGSAERGLTLSGGQSRTQAGGPWPGLAAHPSPASWCSTDAPKQPVDAPHRGGQSTERSAGGHRRGPHHPSSSPTAAPTLHLADRKSH